VEAAELFVLLEIFPRRIGRRLRLGSEQRLRARIGEKEKIAADRVRALPRAGSRFCRTGVVAGLEVSDVRSRSLDPMGDFFLGKIQLPPTLTDHLPKVSFLGPCHINPCPLLVKWPRQGIDPRSKSN